MGDTYPLHLARADPSLTRTVSHSELREILLRAVENEERFQRNVELVRESRRQFIETRNTISPEGRG
jgi:hypothetical protein